MKGSQNLKPMTLLWNIAFQTPLVDISKARKLQKELTDLSKDNIQILMFDVMKDPTEIWKKQIKYPHLRHHASR